MFFWQVLDFPAHPLWANLGFTYAAEDWAPVEPIHWWQDAHPLFNQPESVPEFTTIYDHTFNNGQYMQPLAGAAALAGYTTGPADNQAALILANSGRTIYKGFGNTNHPGDLDSDGQVDGIELWMNMISYLLSPFLMADPPSLQAALELGEIMTGTLDLSANGFETFFAFSELPGGFTMLELGSTQALDFTAGPTLIDALPSPWDSLPNMPLAVIGSAGAVVDGKFYVIGGQSSDASLQGKVQIYDPATGSWDDTATTMPAPASEICAGVIGSDIYVPGGYSPGTLNTLQVFHSTTQTWDTIASDPLPVPGYGLACSAYQGRLYVFGGYSFDFLNTALVYDPLAAAGARWTALTGAPMAGAAGSAELVGDLIFYAGFINGTGDRAEVYAYDPAANDWITYPSLAVPHGMAGMWAAGSMLYVGGGGWMVPLTSMVEEYDLSLGTGGVWAPASNLLEIRSRFAHASSPETGRLFLGAGVGGSGYLNTAEWNQHFDTNLDVPWLSEQPLGGHLEAGDLVPVEITYDASVVDQPGVYTATLRADYYSPNAPLDIPISMNVTAPPVWGKVEGVVSGLGYCDANPLPLAGAQVVIESALGTVNLTTSPDGEYAYWLDQAYSPLTINVTYPDHQDGLASGVTITAGQLTTQGFDLRWLKPCALTQPGLFEVQVPASYQATRVLDVSNGGAAGMDVALREKVGPAGATALAARPQDRTPAISVPAGSWPGQSAPQVNPLPGLLQDPAPYSAPSNPAETDSLVPLDLSITGFIPTETSTSGAVDPLMVPLSPAASPWTAVANYPDSVVDPAAAAKDGKIYVVGGYSGNTNTYLDTAYVYDPAVDAWSPIKNLPSPRYAASAAWIGDYLYVAGGYNGSSSMNNLEIYDPVTDTWTSGTPIPTVLARASQVVLDDQLYLIGGSTITDNGNNKLWRYNPATDAWTGLADYPEPIMWTSCGAIDDQIYCAGGLNQWGGSESIHTYAYDPASNTWSVRADMPYTAWGAGYTASGGRLYISGGMSGWEVTNRSLSYDPALDAWLPEANANTLLVRGGSACGFYRIGGVQGFWYGFSNSAEVYPGLDDCAGEYLDVPWLSEDPITATLDADTGLPVDVTFTALPGMDAGEVYTATLQVKSTDEFNSLIEIPVQLTVVARDSLPLLNPPASAQSGKLGQTLTYTIQVTNNGNVPSGYSLSLGAHAWTSALSTAALPALDPGESATFDVQVTVPASAHDGDSEKLVVTVTSQDDATQHAAVELTTTAMAYMLFLPVSIR
jgi:N-acetylneuraminic acid mutarotase